jgi:RNA polymerase sigma-70 factor (ECF subfamily)
MRPALHHRWLDIATGTVPALPEFALPFRERIAVRYLPQQQTLADADVETATLIERFQAGETETLGVLYTKYFSQVYACLRLAVDCAEEAANLTQETWHRVAHRLGRFGPSARPFRRWLLRIARQVLLDELVRRRGLPMVPTEGRSAGETSRGAADPVEKWWFADQPIRDAIEELGLRHREVLVMRYFLDLSYSEIGRLTGTSAALARQLKGQALHELSLRGPVRHDQDLPGGGGGDRWSMRLRPRALPVLSERQRGVGPKRRV